MNNNRVIYCQKLKKQAPGLTTAPFPGKLGEKIYYHISKSAWQQWIQHQTMLLNEYRLNSLDPKARKFIEQEMEKFLFGDGSAKPEGYVANTE